MGSTFLFCHARKETLRERKEAFFVPPVRNSLFSKDNHNVNNNRVWNIYDFQNYWEAVRVVGNALLLAILKMCVMPGGT